MNNQMQNNQMQSQQHQVAIIQKDITDSVNHKLTDLQKEGLVVPANYNASNALKSAFFKLQEVKDRNGKRALDVCTRESIANSLLDMVVQGLSPAKTQCYFVVYGNTLSMTRSYFGTQTVLKRLQNVKDIWANVIYKDDVFDYENYRGRERLISHKTAFENRDKEILGAYAVVLTADDQEILTVMTRKEIETSWGQSKTGQAVHKKFPQEMAKRTVINRAAKAFINTSDDSDLLVDAINRTTENEYDNERDYVVEAQVVQQEIDANANQGDVIDIPAQSQQPTEPVQQPAKQTIDVQHTETEQHDLFADAPSGNDEDMPY